ncbi:MAG TPA: secondary thiamine-phosphate synthase enzyme YjbQ, partial [Ignavibacteriaceae bacterium]
MKCIQKELTLEPKARGFHLITDEILAQLEEINNIKAGIAHIFIKHTSASLTLNENADPSVRRDLEKHFNKLVPEDTPYFEHDSEGPDDMPAHIKSVILGSSVSIPIKDGHFNLGVWQG